MEEAETASDLQSPENNAALIGGVVGGVIALLLVGILIAILMRNRRNRKGQCVEEQAADRTADAVQSTRAPPSNYGLITTHDVPPSNYVQVSNYCATMPSSNYTALALDSKY